MKIRPYAGSAAGSHPQPHTSRMLAQMRERAHKTLATHGVHRLPPK